MTSTRSRKPLPLKQRTSSLDQRRDYSSETWISVIGLLKLREFFVTVDHFSIWRRHIAWAMDDGKELRSYLTQRYASSMVFLSLLLSAELNVLFNSAGVTTTMRHALEEERTGTVSFWAGLFIIISVILSLLSLISTFTAWTMVSAVSSENAHCIFRSSIGQYVAELPGRFIVGATYSFLVWVCLFFFLLLPVGFFSALLLILALGLFVHTIAAFSAFGRVIMHTGAMSPNKIFDKSYETNLLPHSLHRLLVVKARANLSNNTSIRRQYMSNVRPIAEHLSDDEMSGHLHNRSTLGSIGQLHSPPAPALTRKRTESLVKFADGFDTNGERINVPPPSVRSTVSALSMESPPPASLPRPRPTANRQSMDAASAASTDTFGSTPRHDGMTQSISSSTTIDHDFTDRWLNSPDNSQLDFGSMNPEASHQQHDGLEILNVMEIDNPYLMHKSKSPLRDGTAGSLDLSEDELFEQQYGDLFDPVDNNIDDEEKQRLLGQQNRSQQSYQSTNELVDDNSKPSALEQTRKTDHTDEK